MFIHIGDRKVISDKNCVGIFNTETLKISESNNWLLKGYEELYKTAVVLLNGTVEYSTVSSFTVMKRKEYSHEFIWRRKDDE